MARKRKKTVRKQVFLNDDKSMVGQIVMTGIARVSDRECDIGIDFHIHDCSRRITLDFSAWMTKSDDGTLSIKNRERNRKYHRSAIDKINRMRKMLDEAEKFIHENTDPSFL
ncbi:MAG: hypothetical protein BV459_01860 [Thermoplasmata archaeon M11B2D]|nr:MAG: hypothetical protein BV459_01860 [Thermoplasmata archaeon M11B2D]